MAHIDVKGLISPMAQQWDTEEVLMVACTNEEQIRAIFLSCWQCGTISRSSDLGASNMSKMQALRDMYIKNQTDNVSCHTGRGEHDWIICGTVSDSPLDTCPLLERVAVRKRVLDFSRPCTDHPSSSCRQTLGQ